MIDTNTVLVSQYIGAISQGGRVYWALDTPRQEALIELVKCRILDYIGTKGILAVYKAGPNWNPDYISPNEYRDKWRQLQRMSNDESRVQS